MYISNYRLQKKRSDKCLENPVSGDRSTSKMVNGPKHCCNLGDGNFIRFIDHCEHNSVRKTLF